MHICTIYFNKENTRFSFIVVIPTGLSVSLSISRD